MTEEQIGRILYLAQKRLRDINTAIQDEDTAKLEELVVCGLCNWEEL